MVIGIGDGYKPPHLTHHAHRVFHIFEANLFTKRNTQLQQCGATIEPLHNDMMVIDGRKTSCRRSVNIFRLITQQVFGRPQTIARIHLNDTTHGYIGTMTGGGIIEFFATIDIDPIIRIDIIDKLTLSKINATISCTTQSLISLGNNANPGILRRVSTENFGRRVCASIINTKNLDITQSLRTQRIETTSQTVIYVINRHDDTNFRGHYSRLDTAPISS